MTTAFSNKASKYMMACENQPLPNDFKKWLEDEVFADCRYLYFGKISDKRKKKGLIRYLGTCNYCGKQHQFESIKHLSKIVCAGCGSTLRARYMRYFCGERDKKVVAYIQKHGEEFIERYFLAIKRSDVDKEKWGTVTEIDFQENQRDVIHAFNKKKQQFHRRGGSGSSYMIASGKIVYLHEHDWLYGPYAITYGGDMSNKKVMYTYHKNLAGMLSTTNLRYSAAGQYFAANHDCAFYEYIKAYQEMPILETILKIGATSVAHDLVFDANNFYDCYDRKRSCSGLYDKKFAIGSEKNVYKLLGIKEKRDFRYILDNNFSIKEIFAFMQLKYFGGECTRKLILMAAECSLFEDWAGPYNKQREQEIIVTLFNRNAAAFLKYAESQIKGDRTISNFVGDYWDYAKAAREMGYNMADTLYFKPKNFYEMHDRTIAANNARKDAISVNAFKESVKGYLGIHFEKYKLAVQVAKSPEELTQEGKALGHCVGSYAKRVSEGSSLIFFVRKADEPDLSYYTLEVQPAYMKLVQCRGEHNKDYIQNKIVEKFVNEFIEVLHETFVSKKLKVTA
jgi:hypothetical protein